MTSSVKTIVVISIFAIAMAALESAVVVYLRALYYPGEFTVAMKVIDESVLLVELAREAATIIMLLAIGYLTGKNFRERFAYFLLSFAVWDIFYYIWLKVFINWPLSLFEWDILFLMPVTWLGPVLAPVICSVTMIVLAGVLLKSGAWNRITPMIWFYLITGCLIILYTFMKDYSWMMIEHNLFGDYLNILQNKDFVRLASGYIPSSFDWGVFGAGEVVIGAGIIMLWKQTGTDSVTSDLVRLFPNARKA